MKLYIYIPVAEAVAGDKLRPLELQEVIEKARQAKEALRGKEQFKRYGEMTSNADVLQRGISTLPEQVGKRAQALLECDALYIDGECMPMEYYVAARYRLPVFFPDGSQETWEH